MRVEISKGFPSRSNHRRLGSFFSLLFLLLSTSDSLGQSTVLRVVDGKSKEPLPYSTVQLEGYAVGYICDKDGFALIEMPEEIEDLRHLKLSHVGYASKIVHIDILSEDSIVIDLDPFSIQLEELLISEPFESIRSLSAAEAANKVILRFNSSKSFQTQMSSGNCTEQIGREKKIYLYAEHLGMDLYIGNSNFSPMAAHKYWYEKSNIAVDTEGWKTLSKDRGYQTEIPTSCSGVFNYYQWTAQHGILSLDDGPRIRYSWAAEDSLEQQDVFSIAFKSKWEEGYLIFDDYLQLLELRFTKADKMWSDLSNKRVPGSGEYQFLYFRNVPYIDRAKIQMELKGLIQHINVENHLVRFDSVRLTDQEIMQINRLAENPWVQPFNSQASRRFLNTILQKSPDLQLKREGWYYENGNRGFAKEKRIDIGEKLFLKSQ